MKYLIALVWLWVTPTWAQMTAEISKPKISIQDTFKLTLSVDGASQGMPDFIPLQHDFEINATEHRVSTVVINGQMQTLNQWSVILKPKKLGTLTIPSLSIGTEKSHPLDIEVISTYPSIKTKKSKSNTSDHHNDRVLLKTELSDSSAYINQQIIYTVKLMHQDQLLDASYQPPTLDDALIMPLGESEQYQSVENGVHYWVEEQRYAIFPQKLGRQQLTSPIFQALIFRGMPQRVQVQDNPLILDVKPNPKPNWLPAKSIQMNETYDSKQKQLTVGTPLVRVITIEGQAIPAELLPTLTIKNENNVGVYPEKPVLKNTIHDPDLVGIKTLKITYLLNQAGEITLPSYSIHWFNTTTGKEETSTIPSRIIHVEASTLSPTTPERPFAKPTVGLPESHASQSVSTLSPAPDARLPWIIAIGMGALWLITILFYFWYKHRSYNHQKPLHLLKTACNENNPAKARAALLVWANAIWSKKSFLNLDDIRKHIANDELELALAGLSEALYQKEKTQTWNGDSLWNSVKDHQVGKKVKRKYSSLPPLNPD